MLLAGAEEHSNCYNFQPNINSIIRTGSYCMNHHRTVPSLWQDILVFISKGSTQPDLKHQKPCLERQNSPELSWCKHR